MISKTKDSLNTKSSVYYHIQGALAITDRQYCQFVAGNVTTNIQIWVERDDNFWLNKIVPKVTFFYELAMLPEILDSRLKRNLPLRDSRVSPKDRHRKTGESQHEHESDEEMQRPKLTHSIVTRDFNPPIVAERTHAVEMEPSRGMDVARDELNEHVWLRNKNEALLAYTCNQLTVDDIIIIRQNAWLNSSHMDVFGRLMMQYTGGLYEYITPNLGPGRDQIQPIDPFRRHIQIFNDNSEHWVCAFYDGEKKYIYDSGRGRRFSKDYADYLQPLFPNYCFTENFVQFPNVELQPNGYDCGVYSIAFAHSLIYGINPENVRYERSKLRTHLEEMLTNHTLAHFPLAPDCVVEIPPLHEALDALRGRLHLLWNEHDNSNK